MDQPGHPVTNRMITKLAHCPKDVTELRRKTRGNPKPSDSVGGRASDTFSLVTLQSHRLHVVDRSLDFLGNTANRRHRVTAKKVRGREQREWLKCAAPQL